MDPTLPETWDLERELRERLGRQYRCIGDAFAWRVFGFQRKQIIALSQSDPPGPMANKRGLPAELAALEQARAEGKFAILHDLTNCLRIGDVTVFDDDGMPKTIEVKSDPSRRSPAQKRKIKAAAAAVRDNAPLPGQDPKTRLYDLDLPFKTYLDVLRLGTERAARDGIFTSRIPGGRMLLVTDIYRCNAQGWTEEQFGARHESRRNSALRRGGISDDSAWLVTNQPGPRLTGSGPGALRCLPSPSRPRICALDAECRGRVAWSARPRPAGSCGGYWDRGISMSRSG